MKALLIAVICLFTIQTSAMAGNEKPIQVNQLPAVSQQFIKTHFSDLKVAYAMIDKELFDTNYDVIFTNSSKIEFDKKGEWKDIDCNRTAVPAGIIPTPIEQYVKTNHSDTFIVSIDRDRRDYEIELSNGLEIKFDLQFNVIGYDD